jgi:hypothetical protein
MGAATDVGRVEAAMRKLERDGHIRGVDLLVDRCLVHRSVGLQKKSTTRLLTLEPSLPAVVAVDDGEKVLLDLDFSAIFDVAVAG